MSLKDLTGTYVIDPSHTRIGFSARHAMVTKVRGAFTEVEGLAHVDGANPSASDVTVTIQVASFDTRNEGRDAHVKSADFLDAEKYPTLTFVSTNVEQTGDDTVEFTGDLTIKDQTRQITIPFTFEGEATDPFGNHRIGFEGGTSISRADYGITWNAALESGGVLVSDKVALEFEISAIKQS